ncbi:hypothetical protein AB0N21_32430 [Streptomyces sp. NPDC051080]|uniref:hypothetical protein n=1 Tax=Streptomyces sp. NPDC051080 TaxID=3157222 RepID=UPI0034181A6F
MLFNSLYVDAAVEQAAADGFPVTDELLARLSPLFTRPAAPGLRQLRDPHTDEDDDDCRQEWAWRIGKALSTLRASAFLLAVLLATTVGPRCPAAFRRR